MATPLQYLEALPCGIAELFGYKPAACRTALSAIRGMPQAGREGAEFYDGLVTDAERVLSFPAQVKDANGNPTGDVITKRFTVAQLMSLGSNWKASTARLQSVYDRARDISVESVLSAQDQATMLTDQWWGGEGPRANQKRSIHLADTRGILTVPNSQDGFARVDLFNPTDARLVPGWFPKLNDRCPIVSLTPRVLDRAAVSTQRLQELQVDLVTAVFEYLRDRNVPMIFCPEVIGARQNYQIGFNNQSSYDDNSGWQATQAWYRDNRDENYLLKSSAHSFTFPDGDPNQGPQFGGTNQSLWWTSLDRRVPITIGGDSYLTNGVWGDQPRKLSWPTTTADGVLELARWLNVAKVLLTTGNASVDARATMVPLFAAQAVYQGAQVAAYRQVNKPYGSNVVNYRAALEREVNARKNLARTGAVNVAGYHSTGDDTADIATGIIGCVGLAVKDALDTGNPIVFVPSVIGRALLFCLSWLTSSDNDIVNPYAVPLRMVYGQRGVQLFGISTTNALLAPPAFRIPDNGSHL